MHVDGHPMLTAALYGVVETDEGVFTPITNTDRLIAKDIIAGKLNPAPDPHFEPSAVWYLPEGVEVTRIQRVAFIDALRASLQESPCHSLQPSPGPSPTVESTPAPCDPSTRRTP
jgi:hypothetical protein